MDNLSAAKGCSKGEINLHWDSDENADSYIIEIACISRSKNTKWEILDIISDSHYTVRNLKSKKDYMFRIASADEKGKKETSPFITKKAP
ncbi:MAG: fibronectin type III domain-containing protein [Ignavibacteria bacterium]